MSLNINVLITRMKNRLPDPVFKAVDNDFWISILFDETLPTVSSFYPSLVKGITVTQDMGIEVLDTFGRRNSSTKYVVPLVDEMYPYTGISTFHYPRNFLGGGVYSNNGPIDAFASKVMTSTNMVDVRFIATFEAPNIVVISPPPKVHMDFTVSMYKMKKLEEISTGYHEIFKSLYEADCKIALYYKFYTVSEGGVYGGIELRDYISDFKEYESKRDEILEVFEGDYYKDPIRFEEVMSMNTGYV